MIEEVENLPRANTPSASVLRFLANRGTPTGMARKALHCVRVAAIGFRRFYLRRFWGVDLHPTCRISLKANLDLTNPRGVHVGAGSYVAFGAVILAHDMSRLVHMHTSIGRNCFIGAHAIIMPGVSIGDQCIVGAGSVVTKDIPANSVCVGNPARVVKSGIRTRTYGILEEVYEAAVAFTGAEKERVADSEGRRLSAVSGDRS